MITLGTGTTPRWGRSWLLMAAFFACSKGEGVLPRVVISEIMYHPVLEQAAEDEHEFVEIHNPGAGEVGLAGWKLRVDGRDGFVFPPGAALAPREYRVIARRRARLAEVSRYRLDAAQLFGDLAVPLGNDGGKLALVDAHGETVEAVAYDDRWPWPVGADGLGAGEGWLPDEWLPLERHRHMGRSLERYHFAVPGTELRNWEASPLDGATPGRQNSVRGEPPAVVTALSVGSQAGGPLIEKGQPVVIAAVLSGGAASELTLEYFVDDLSRVDEPPTALPMRAVAGAFRALVPGLGEGAIVRYRIRGRRGGAAAVETLSPRPSDPFRWHAYFVNGAAGTAAPASRTYQLFIAPDRWTTLWTNLTANGVAGPNAGCLVNPTWNARVPAVFVVDGKVYDVRVRYQGSRSLRRSGTPIAAWPGPGPAEPRPLLALSWNVSFPRYAPFEKRRQLTLKKQYQACPGVLNAAMAELYWAAGIPSDRFRFVRLHVNGSYYDYMLDVEGLSEEVMQRHEAAPDGRVGDLFKADGSFRDEGPWGPSDWSPLPAACGFTADQRHATTYERQTNDWKEGPGDPEVAEIMAMIQALPAAAAAGPPEVRAYLERHFDVQQLLTVNAMRNFLGVWDDGYHNYQLYKRLSDRKWVMFPLDLDHELGGDPNGPFPLYAHPPTSSLYFGEAGNGSNRLAAVNRLKDALIKAYRPEFDRKLHELAAGVLSAENVLRAIDESHAQFQRDDWLGSPAAKFCDVDARVQAARTWIKERHLVLRYLGVR